jgi:hypothetical protein
MYIQLFSWPQINVKAGIREIDNHASIFNANLFHYISIRVRS